MSERITKKEMAAYQRWMKEGADAKAAGVAYDDCPYLYALIRRSAWLQGWKQAPDAAEIAEERGE